MNKTISLLCPTRGRPDRVHTMLESIIITTDNPEYVEVLYYIDNDDNTKEGYLETIDNLVKKHNVHFKKVEPYIGEPISISKSWNILAERCSGDVLVMANDDEVWITKGWDSRLNEEVEKFPDDIYCIYFDDGFCHGKGCSFPMVSRTWYETLGYFTPGIFKFLCNDTWIEHIAKSIYRLHYVHDVLIEHRHVLYNKSQMDDTYKRHSDNIGTYNHKEFDRDLLYSTESRKKINEEANKLINKMNISKYQIIELNNKISSLENKLISYEMLSNKINIIERIQTKIIDYLAWFIPFRKKRDEFRKKIFDNKQNEYFICKNIYSNEFCEYEINFTKEIIKELDYNTILDFGCGYGRLSKAFDSSKYIGIDLNPKALEIAKKNNIGYRYMKISEKEHYPNADIIYINDVFSHLNDYMVEMILMKFITNTNRYVMLSEIIGLEWKPEYPFAREKGQYIILLKKYGYELYKEYKEDIDNYNSYNKIHKNKYVLIFKK